MEKVFVAQRVANKLFATEASVDAALVDASQLMAELVAARSELKLSAVFGAETQAKLMEAMKALDEARTAMVEVHSGLEEAKLRVGIRTKMVGAADKDRYASISEDLRQVG
jgi:hypothetical protein